MLGWYESGWHGSSLGVPAGQANPAGQTKPPTVAFTVLGVTVTTLAGVSVGLSYWVWKNDPDRDTYSAASD